MLFSFLSIYVKSGIIINALTVIKVGGDLRFGFIGGYHLVNEVFKFRGHFLI